MRQLRGGPGPEHRRDRVHGVDVSSLAAGPAGDANRAAQSRGDVVLVHGLAVSNRYLAPSLRALASDRRVFAPDLPGVGRSSRPGRELSTAELVDGLRDWMDVVGVDQAAAVVGHSLGCVLVAQLAARHPDRVAAVVLVSPGLDPEQRSLGRQVWGLLRDGFRERPSMVRIAVSDYSRVGARRMWRTLRKAQGAEAAISLGQIRQPTLVVHGERDPLSSASWAQRLARDLPAGSVVIISGAPHGVPYSATGPFVDAVRTFLDGHGSVPSTA